MRKKPLVTGNRLTGWSIQSTGFDSPDAVILEVNSSSDSSSAPITIKSNLGTELQSLVEKKFILPVHDSEDSNSGEKITKPSSPSSKRNHNEVEKNRRAKLRCCFDKLKEVVPAGPEVQKHTTQGLLVRAKNFIKTLERRQNRYATFKHQLTEEQRYLRRRLDELHHISNGGSGSFNSTTSSLSTPSSIIPTSSVLPSTSQTLNPTSTTPHILKRRHNHDSTPVTTVTTSSQPTLNASFICCDNATQSVGSDEVELMGAVEGASNANIRAAHVTLENDQSHSTISFDPGLSSHRVEMKFVGV